MNKNIFFILTSFGLLNSGCQILTPYIPPKTLVPKEWKTEPAENVNETPQPQLEQWWEVFNDKELNQLEEQAVKESNTLWAAYERVIQSRQQASLNRSYLYPQLGFNPSFSRTGSLFQSPFSSPISQAATATTAASSASPTIFRFVQSQYLLPIAMSYEIDLWSQLENNYQSYAIRSEAVIDAYFGVLVSLTADIASHYFSIRGLDRQIAVIERNIKGRERELEINSGRYRAGIITFLDVSRAELELARAKSDLDDARRLRGVEENILAALVGVPSSLFTLPSDPIINDPPFIPTGLPSQLLCRRPDIQEAERDLASNYRQIGVAYADFFPGLNLSGALGLGSPFTDQLFSWKARFWQVGWNVMQTVFDGGKNEANLQIAKSVFRESLANYQQTVLNAFQETESALIELKEYNIQKINLEEAVRAAKKTFELSSLRYEIGLVTYLDVVQAERDMLQTEQSLASVVGQLYVSTVKLIRALGGGWSEQDDPKTEIS